MALDKLTLMACAGFARAKAGILDDEVVGLSRLHTGDFKVPIYSINREDWDEITDLGCQARALRSFALTLDDLTREN